MKLVKEFKIIAAAALATGIMAGSSAIAGTVPAVGDANYEGHYDALSAKTGSNFHTIWLPGLNSASTAITSNYWQFEGANSGDGNSGGHGLFVFGTAPFTASNVASTPGVTARLTGTIRNNANSNYKFDVDMAFNWLGRDASRTPKCEYGGNCSDATYQSNADNYDYFGGSGTLTGVGALAGLNLNLTQHPEPSVTDPWGKYPGQLGYAANNKTPDGGTFADALQTFGFSMWLKIFVASGFADQTLGIDVATNQQLGDHGDINLELDYPIPTPIPAALPLFGSGLALLGFMGWRRKRQDPDAMAA